MVQNIVEFHTPAESGQLQVVHQPCARVWGLAWRDGESHQQGPSGMDPIYLFQSRREPKPNQIDFFLDRAGLSAADKRNRLQLPRRAASYYRDPPEPSGIRD